jgi:vomeronasal 2 receptor
MLPGFQLHSFLKTYFINPVGDRGNINQREKIQEEYDIFYIWNFFTGKIGKFNPYFPNWKQLFQA